MSESEDILRQLETGSVDEQLAVIKRIAGLDPRDDSTPKIYALLASIVKQTDDGKLMDAALFGLTNADRHRSNFFLGLRALGKDRQSSHEYVAGLRDDIDESRKVMLEWIGNFKKEEEESFDTESLQNLIIEFGVQIPELIPAIFEQLLGRPGVQHHLAVALGEIGRENLKVARRATFLLDDPDDCIQKAGVEILCGIGGGASHAVLFLADMLDETNDDEMVSALENAIGSIGSESNRAFDDLFDHLLRADEQDGLLACTVGSIAGCTPYATGRLAAALNDSESRVRKAAASAFSCGSVSDPHDFVDDFRSALNDDDMDVRMAALIGLKGAIHKCGEELLPVFRQSLADPYFAVRSLAAQALGELGPAARAAVPDLVKLMNEETEDPSVRRESQKALRAIETNST